MATLRHPLCTAPNETVLEFAGYEPDTNSMTTISFEAIPIMTIRKKEIAWAIAAPAQTTVRTTGPLSVTDKHRT
jgi:hypothetical protein